MRLCRARFKARSNEGDSNALGVLLVEGGTETGTAKADTAAATGAVAVEPEPDKGKTED